MKAEHRKELQTNVLADRMGKLVHRMKRRPQRRTYVYVIASVVALALIFLFYRARETAAQERSQQWFKLEDGFRPYMDELMNDHAETNAGKAARFQHTWMMTWDGGVKVLAAKPVQAFEYLQVAEKRYKKLLQDCAGDPVWEPEALYALAVIDETRAVHREERDKHLERAQAMYKKVASEHKDSAHGKLAKKRLEVLENKEKMTELRNFYADLEARLNIDNQLRDAEMMEKIRAKLKSTK